jgi:tetratricopeptide (TPR) repeat protein
MTCKAAVPLAAILCASCAHQKRIAVAPPSAPTVWQRQIQNAADAGDGDIALKTLRNRIAAEPNNVAARLDLANAYRERGYHEVALEVCRLAAERFPDSTEAQMALVRTLYDMKRPADAIAALEAHPRQTPAYYSWLGLIQDSTGAWESGEPSHRKAVELAPAQDAPHNNLGYNLLMQKKNDAAAAEFREALRLNPSSAVATISAWRSPLPTPPRQCPNGRPPPTPPLRTTIWQPSGLKKGTGKRRERNWQ